MPILETAINEFIDFELIRQDEAQRAKHEPSGKLSAGMLYQPLRFQVMKTIGVPTKKFDAYMLGKFKRGRDVEDWFVGAMDRMGILKEKQKKVTYKGAIGFVDALVDTSLLQFKNGVMPHEVKSVTNAKLKRIGKTGVDWHYQIQACFYALGLDSKHYAVDIISAEDLRPNVYVFNTHMLSGEVDTIIDNYEKAMEKWNTKKLLPELIPHPQATWTINPMYAMFDAEWLGLNDNQIRERLNHV